MGAVSLILTGQQYSDSAPRQQTATGTIVSHERANHNRYGYRFEVGGRSYSGAETPRWKEPKIGDLVKVYYDSADPSQNSLSPFVVQGDAMIIPAYAILVLSGIITLFVLLFGPV